MDDLPVEILLCIAETSSSLPELLVYRNISKRFRHVVDKNCKPLAFELGCHHIESFYDALLVIRLKRIPLESCCHYDLAAGDYSFYPSKDFFDTVMQGTEVPSGCPNIPFMSWYEEVAAVMDLYLLALAWFSTITCGGGPNSTDILEGSDGLRETGARSEVIEAYVRSFFRISVLTSVYGPRIYAEPIATVLAQFEGSRETDWRILEKEVRKMAVQHPMLTAYTQRSPDKPSYTLFNGFFEWLYAQPRPDRRYHGLDLDDPDDDDDNWSVMSKNGPERQQVALMQLWKIYERMCDRNKGVEPTPAHHVASRSNPMYPELSHPSYAYRLPLRLSAWSEPLNIIEDWAHSLDNSLVLHKLKSSKIENEGMYQGGVLEHSVLGFLDDLWRFDLFENVLQAELKNRFGLKYAVDDGGELPDLASDILNPLYELEDWNSD
jgi:hypothetical protein